MDFQQFLKRLNSFWITYDGFLAHKMYFYIETLGGDTTKINTSKIKYIKLFLELQPRQLQTRWQNYFTCHAWAADVEVMQSNNAIKVFDFFVLNCKYLR